VRPKEAVAVSLAEARTSGSAPPGTVDTDPGQHPEGQENWQQAAGQIVGQIAA
jgi:hypothetical protein